MLVRLATLDDVDAIARVHVRSWREAYAGLLPQAHLDALDANERAERWVEWIQLPLSTTLIAEEAGDIIGFASCGAARDDAPAGYDAEIYAIYVLARAKGQGTGRAMFDACREATGGRALVVWVLEKNAPARRFYEQLGGRLVGRKKTDVGGQPFEEVAYGWPASGLS